MCRDFLFHLRSGNERDNTTVDTDNAVAPFRPDHPSRGTLEAMNHQRQLFNRFDTNMRKLPCHALFEPRNRVLQRIKFATHNESRNEVIDHPQIDLFANCDHV